MLVSAEQLAPAALIDAFEAAFADYLVGPFTMDLERWPLFLARQQVDLTLSRAWLDDAGIVQAFALVAARGRSWRLAGMGARPAARGSGASRALMDDFLARGQAAGLASLELEVFEQNERALRLYQRYGFVPLHRLMGHRAAASGGEPLASPFPDVGRQAALAWLDALRIDDLPLQVTAPVLAVNTAPWRAWQSGSAQLVFHRDGAQLNLLSLIDTDSAQRHAETLVRALRAAHPDDACSVVPLQRDDLGGAALTRLGFQRWPHNQWLMRRPLRD